MDEVGRRLAQWRTEAGLSQAAVAEAVGEILGRRVGQSVVGNYETRGTPRSWQFLVALAQRFPPSVLDLDWLLRGTEGEDDTVKVNMRSSALPDEGQFIATKMASLPFEFPDHILTGPQLSDARLETFIKALDVALRSISWKVYNEG
jgi:transcriptional regulator with XRE-family HTH domain